MTDPTPDVPTLRRAVLAELDVCQFIEDVTDASMCRCGLPAINHDTYAEQIVSSDHPAIANVLDRLEAAEGAVARVDIEAVLSAHGQVGYDDIEGCECGLWLPGSGAYYAHVATALRAALAEVTP